MEKTIESAKNDRPRIVVMLARLNQMITDKPVWCEMEIGNIGNNPAYVNCSYAVIFPEVAGKDIDQAVAPELSVPNAIIDRNVAPGGVVTVDTYLLKTLSAESIDDILEGRVRLFFFGAIYYWDSLAEQNRETRFCLLYNYREKRFGIFRSPSLQHNYMD